MVRKKQPDLKKRLDHIRSEPEAPVLITLALDADLYRALAVRAAESGQSLETFVAALLAAQVEAE